MSIISDYRGIRKQAKAMTPPEHRGLAGGFRAAQDGMAKANEALARLQEEQARQAQLAHGARSGQAVIVALRDTGVTIGDNPVVRST